MGSRLEQLRAHLKNRPTDPFLRYAVGIELKNENQLAEAAAAFESLVIDSPAYVPTYYHLGQTLEALSRPEEALSRYEQGIARAAEAKDSHAAQELSQAAHLLKAQLE